MEGGGGDKNNFLEYHFKTQQKLYAFLHNKKRTDYHISTKTS